MKIYNTRYRQNQLISLLRVFFKPVKLYNLFEILLIVIPRKVPIYLVITGKIYIFFFFSDLYRSVFK